MHNYFAGFTFTPAEHAIITMFIVLFIMFVLSPALAAFIYAWHVHKHPPTQVRWYKKPVVLIVFAILYIVSIPLYFHGTEVQKALKITNAYNGPIHAVSLEGHTIKTVYATDNGEFGKTVRFFYKSPLGSYTIEQHDHIDSLNKEALEPCTSDNDCQMLADMTIGTAYYYARGHLSYTIVKSEHRIMKLIQYGDATDRSPEAHAKIVKSLRPISSNDLLTQILFKIRRY